MAGGGGEEDLVKPSRNYVTYCFHAESKVEENS